jgi:putative colanic acid biosynthesis acetyltransferase WcaF
MSTSIPAEPPRRPSGAAPGAPGRGPDNPGPSPAGASGHLTRRRSVWTTRQKAVRALWGLAAPLWALVPGARPALLRLFGGTVGPGCRLGRRVQIVVPWNVSLGANVEVGDDVILYSLGRIDVGDRCVLDVHAHLCAGTHDHTNPRFPLVTPPIDVGAGCFVGADAYVGPGVTLGENCVVLPRASVYKDFPAATTLRGNPARPVVEGEEDERA